MAKEKLFENKVKKWLTEHHCWYVKYWAGGGFTKAGVPDLLVCAGGEFVGVEIKAEDGHPSDLQLHAMDMIEEANGWSVLLYPQDFTLFMNFILCLKANDKKNAVINYLLLNKRREKYELT